MDLYKKLFKQTVIYGLATVLPKMFSFILVPIYTNLLPKSSYGEITEIFAYMIFLNIILSYGMETVFFRFYNTELNKKGVIETSMISIFWTTVGFLFLSILFRNTISQIFDIDVEYITYAIWILTFDSLVTIPFSKLRANQRAKSYSIIKIGSVVINLFFNIFFLKFLPNISITNPNGILSAFYIQDFEIGYILLSNTISSLITFIILLPNYFNLNWRFDFNLWKKMMKYGFPVLIAGIAFAINDQFDKILLANLLPKNIAESEVGIYSACYKIGLFMVLYRTAYTLGIEPFFFSHASNANAPQTYALVTKYFVIFGSLILLFVIVFVDFLKIILIRDSSYWEAMKVVPLIILANFFLGIYTNLSVWYKLVNKTHIGAYISIIGAILTLIINFALIPTMSYYGSAIATLIAYGSMMCISYRLGNKYYPIPYDKKKIIYYLMTSILFSIISFYYFRENYYVGVSLLIIFIYTIYKNEKNVFFSIIRSRKS